jgi:hypothetical protein
LRDPIYALLRREVQVVGRQFEALPYERLLDFDDSLAYQAKNIDGIDIYFNSDLISVEKNGDLHICIDAQAVVPGWKWRDVLPSYDFWKRKDGTVFDWPPNRRLQATARRGMLSAPRLNRGR